MNDQSEQFIDIPSKETKAILQELLRRGLIEANKNINSYQIALAKRTRGQQVPRAS